MECKFILLNHRTQVTFANFPLGCLKGKRLLRVDIPGYYCLISSGDGPAAECRVIIALFPSYIRPGIGQLCLRRLNPSGISAFY